MQTILLTSLVILALLSVCVKDLLKAAIFLGIFSAILSVMFFKFNSPYAAVFELSVCAGLITVLFTSIVSLTENKDDPDKKDVK